MVPCHSHGTKAISYRSLSASTHSSSPKHTSGYDSGWGKELSENTPVLWCCPQLGGRRHHSPASVPGSGAHGPTSITWSIKRTQVIVTLCHISYAHNTINTISCMKGETVIFLFITEFWTSSTVTFLAHSMWWIILIGIILKLNLQVITS